MKILLQIVAPGCLVASLLCVASVVFANPTVTDPTKPLATHNTVPGAAELATQCYATVNALAEFAAKSEQSLQKKGPDSLMPLPLVKWKAKGLQGARDAVRLTIMGEPIGTDLAIRFDGLAKRMDQLTLSMVSTRAARAIADKMIPRVRKSIESIKRDCEKARDMAASQPAEAEKAADMLSIQLEEMIHFLDKNERLMTVPLYQMARTAADNAMTPVRVATARKCFNDAIQANLPDPAALTAWANATASQLRASGKATVEGQGEVAGPQVLAELSRRWGVGHGGLQRVQGLRWALRWHHAANDGRGDDGSSDSTYSEANAWTDTVLAAMATLIAADADSLTPDKVPARHQEYLKVLSSMAALGSSKEVQTKGETALAVLVAKNAGYETSVKTYEAATRDLLTFQGRQLNAAREISTSEYPTADRTFRSVATNDGSAPGFFFSQAKVPFGPCASHSTEVTLAAVGPRLIGLKVAFDDVVRISPTSKASAARLVSSEYGTVPAVTLPEAARRHRMSELCVDETHPPLSIRTTGAIDALNLGNYEAVGGTILTAQIEAVITRAITMSEGAAIIVPRGSVINATLHYSMMNQLVLRMDVDPVWVRHDFGVYRLPGK